MRSRRLWSSTQLTDLPALLLLVTLWRQTGARDAPKGGPHMDDALNGIMGVEEAAQKWGTTSHYVKNLCRAGRCRARKMGKTWVLDRDQPSPIRRPRKGGKSDGDSAL